MMSTIQLLKEYRDLAKKQEEFAQVGDFMGLTSTENAMSRIHRELENKSC